MQMTNVTQKSRKLELYLEKVSPHHQLPMLGCIITETSICFGKKNNFE